MILDRRISQDPVRSLSSCHAEDLVFRQLDATAPSLTWRRSSISGATILLSAAASSPKVANSLREVLKRFPTASGMRRSTLTAYTLALPGPVLGVSSEPNEFRSFHDPSSRLHRMPTVWLWGLPDLWSGIGSPPQGHSGLVENTLLFLILLNSKV